MRDMEKDLNFSKLGEKLRLTEYVCGFSKLRSKNIDSERSFENSSFISKLKGILRF